MSNEAQRTAALQDASGAEELQQQVERLQSEAAQAGGRCVKGGWRSGCAWNGTDALSTESASSIQESKPNSLLQVPDLQSRLADLEADV